MRRRSLAPAALLPAGRLPAACGESATEPAPAKPLGASAVKGPISPELRGLERGVDSQDPRGDAAEFLREYPTPFPHYFDPEIKIARSFGGRRAWPTTAYYDASGKLTKTHIGAFATEEKLDEDTRRYALGG